MSEPYDKHKEIRRHTSSTGRTNNTSRHTTIKTMTESDIKAVAEHLNVERAAKIQIRDSNLPDGTYRISDDLIQEEFDGIFSFDCIVLLKDDLEKFFEFIGGSSVLPIEMKIFVRSPCSTYYWGTTYNEREYMDEAEYKDMIEDGHGITCDRAPPYMQEDKKIILYLDCVQI